MGVNKRDLLRGALYALAIAAIEFFAYLFIPPQDFPGIHIIGFVSAISLLLIAWPISGFTRDSDIYMSLMFGIDIFGPIAGFVCSFVILLCITYIMRRFAPKLVAFYFVFVDVFIVLLFLDWLYLFYLQFTNL